MNFTTVIMFVLPWATVTYAFYLFGYVRGMHWDRNRRLNNISMKIQKYQDQQP